MKTAYRIAAVIAAASALSACVDEKLTKVPDLDRVVTVAEFTKQNQLRKKVVGLCSNDPGTLREDQNCINAMQSERLASVGTGDFPRLNLKLPSELEKSASAAPKGKASEKPVPPLNMPRIDTSLPPELQAKKE